MAEGHSHDSGETHDHDAAGPGHDHAAEHPAVVETTSAGGVTGRLILGLIGAVAIIAGAFLEWVGGIAGTKVPMDVFWSTSGDVSGFMSSAGLVMIVIGLLAVLAFATRGGGLMRLAGALALIGFILFIISAFRAGASVGDLVSNLGIGMWLILAGGIVTLIAGFTSTQRTSTVA